MLWITQVGLLANSQEPNIETVSAAAFTQIIKSCRSANSTKIIIIIIIIQLKKQS